VQKGEERMAKKMLQPITPVRDEALEGADDIIGRSADVLTRDGLKWIPEWYLIALARVEVDGAFDFVFGQ
jgi:hypothetical protein